MDLLEYQAKELFREVGIPVLPSQRIDHPSDLKHLEIPYPVVLKSQVPTGGRGRAGGIRFVENTIDAIAAARAIFNLPILGQYPNVLLAESRYDAEYEFFLAVILDYGIGYPVLLGSSQGGINAEAVINHMQKVVVEQEFSPFYARRLALKMGLQGKLIESVSGIMQKMYQLFVQKDLDLVEINPLGISSTGEVMALDGKITANDSALGRHPELTPLVSTITNGNKQQPLIAPLALNHLNWNNIEGDIGIVCNSSCLATATLDLIDHAKGKPAQCLLVEDSSWDIQSMASPVQQLQSALQQFLDTEDIKVVLINILSSAIASEHVAEVIATYLLSQFAETPVLTSADRDERPTGIALRSRQERNSSVSTLGQRLLSRSEFPAFVIRLNGGTFDAAQQRLAVLPVHWIDSLDKAVEKAVSLAKLAAKSS